MTLVGFAALEMEAKGQLMADLLCAQVLVMVIMETVNCSQNFVYTMKRKVRSSGHHLKVMDNFLENLVEKIESDPECSMKNMAKDLNVSKGTICNAVGKIGLTSYVRRRQLLSMATKNNRVERSKHLISWLKKKPSSMVLVFSDKKNWTVDQSRNARND